MTTTDLSNVTVSNADSGAEFRPLEEDPIFAAGRSFEEFNLEPRLLEGVRKAGFVQPTDIQQRLIPLVLAGRDVLGQAKTGTGKTAAFGLPAMQLVDPGGGPQALILVPTRELAVQVRRELHTLGERLPIRSVAIYGGERRRMQQERLKKNPEIIVGTPGRIMDFQQDGSLCFENIRLVILDEVDRMLDIGFRDDIRHILDRIKRLNSPRGADQPAERRYQTVFVSATISSEIERLARTFMENPEKIVSISGSLTVAQVDQSHLLVERWDKKRLLLHLLQHEEPALTLVFCGTKREVDRVTEYLQKHGVDAHAIHGDMYQNKRDRVMKRLRAGNLSVLIASDVASRGLDVQGISHVINYDLPNDPEVYVHRIGRTARLGRDGIAWAFVAPDEGRMLSSIEQLINREVPRKQYDDFKPSPMPARQRDDSARVEAEKEAERVRKARHLPEDIDEDDAHDPTKFPGGMVPKGLPPRRLGGRLRGRR